MKIEDINRISLLILMWACIYLVYVFTTVGYKKIEIYKQTNDIRKLEIKTEQIDIKNGKLYTQLLKKRINE